MLGSKNTHDRLLRDLTNATNAAFVFVSYTPSPGAQFPVPIEQAYAATAYVAEHGRELNLDSTRLALAGDSADLAIFPGVLHNARCLPIQLQGASAFSLIFE